jgi:ABC-type amino acid transport substrate-binding protein
MRLIYILTNLRSTVRGSFHVPTRRAFESFWVYLCLIAFLASCTSGEQSRPETIRIGVDPSWAPLNFEKQQPYVNGFTEDLLLAIAEYNGIAFEKISADFNTLVDGLNKGRYDAILSSMPPFEFNTAKYDFSQNFLNTGLVLITPLNAKYANVSDLSGELVGIITGSPAAVLLEQNSRVIIRSYPSIPETLDAILSGEIEAAVLDRLPSSAYVRDLYNGKLKTVPTPLTDTGLHAIAKKNSGHFIRTFNKAIERMKKKRSLDALVKKWQLQ